MKTRILALPLGLAVIASAVAQKPPANPTKPDDAAALEDAIRAVDRAKEKSTTPTAESV